MERPRRSTRQSTSNYGSPAQTPSANAAASSSTSFPFHAASPSGSGANGASIPSRYVHDAVAPATPSHVQSSAYHQSPSSAGAAAAAQLAAQQYPMPSVLNSSSGPASSSLFQTASALLSQHKLTPQQQQQQHQTSLHAQHTANMGQQALTNLPAAWLVGRGSAPIPPCTPSAPPRPFGSAAGHPTVPQAMYSTYAARMKAGTTTLLQPMPQSDWYDSQGRPLDPFGQPTDASTPSYGGGSSGLNPYRSSRTSGRSRRAVANVRYAEVDNSDDDLEDETGTEDEGPRGVKRKSSPTTPGEDEEEEEEDPKAYLGLPAPASKMLAKRAWKMTNHIYHSDDDLSKQAGRNEILVPIKIDLETDQYRIKDCFTWNMNEKLVSPHHFAKLLLEDLDLPVEPFATQIQNLIIQQVEDAIGVADIEMEPAAGGVWSGARISGQEGELTLPEPERSEYDPAEEAIKEGRSWDWGLDRRDELQKQWRTKMAKRLDQGRGLGDYEDDLRVIVDYEVQILRDMLRDRLEWDLCSPLTPESFAARLCQDLGLTGEAQALIANSVREQLINHKRAALELGLVGSGRVLHEKEKEIEQAWAELHAEKMEKQRRRLERGDTGSTTAVNSTREPSIQPDPTAEDGTPASADQSEAEQADEQQPQQDNVARANGRTNAEDGETKEKTDEDRSTPAAAVAGDGEDGDEDLEDVETLHLTATATAAPTREGTSTPAMQQPGSISSLTSGMAATRSSARLSALAAAPSPDETSSQHAQQQQHQESQQQVPKLTPAQRLNSATYTVREILSKGPRPLEGIWRDWYESREFGPLLERLQDHDLERLEEQNVRASRRNRREAQRIAATGGTGSRRRR